MDVVAVIFNQKGRALITRRPDHKSFAKQWEFPGGKVKPQESLKQALVRELQEELKVQVSETELHKLGMIETEAITLHFFISELRQSYRPQEHPACAWLTYEELLKKDLCPADMQAVQRFKSKLEPKIATPYK